MDLTPSTNVMPGLPVTYGSLIKRFSHDYQ